MRGPNDLFHIAFMHGEVGVHWQQHAGIPIRFSVAAVVAPRDLNVVDLPGLVAISTSYP
jgi:hypothetical protein